MMTDHPAGKLSSAQETWISRVPLLLAAVAICVITGWNLAGLVRTQAPRNPWEAAEVVEAWRSLHGMPVYESAPDGHSTHMYGALVPWVQGQIFRWVGPNNVSGRVLTLVSALATVTLLALSMRSEGSAWCLPVAWAMLLGVNNRSLQYFSENRPDMTALLFASLAMLLIGLGQESRRWRFVLLGSFCLVLGFFFKQTASVFAAVPMVALLLRGRRLARSEIRLVLVPPVVMGGTILGLMFFDPTIYHYMIEVPRAYRIDYPQAAKHIWEFMAESPLLLVLIGDWIVSDGGSLRKDPRIRWLIAILMLTIPCCVIAYAKVGGAPNSMLPALLAVMAFSALRLPGFVSRLEAIVPSWRVRMGSATLLALLLLFTTFPRTGVRAYAPAWAADYPRAVSFAARLPGTIVCPEDPTIPVFAKQRACRNLYAEFDAHPQDGAWPRAVPECVLAEIRAADYVIDIANYWDDYVNDGLLQELGFARIEETPLDSSSYRVWRRAEALPDRPRISWRSIDRIDPPGKDVASPAR